jgi:hypothetical protein
VSKFAQDGFAPKTIFEGKTGAPRIYSDADRALAAKLFKETGKYKEVIRILKARHGIDITTGACRKLVARWQHSSSNSENQKILSSFFLET